MNIKKIAVAMSGGVDSSMTAYMLKSMGHEVCGVYMKLHNFNASYHEKNISDIKKVTESLGIEYHILDLSDKFKNEVYDYFIEEYKLGKTPNPCVKCNRNIKFGELLKFAKTIGYEYLATGHYVKADENFIYEADDKTKDQSYFLAQIEQDTLKHLIFPMSKYKKEDIIKTASTLPFIKEISQKKESQEICFVDTVYTDVLKKHIPINKKGNVLDEKGNIIGHHKGYMHYTIGKRKGFYVHGAHEPHYVKKIDPKNNTITVSNKEALAKSHIELDNLNLFTDQVELQCTIKLRYRTYKVPCDIFIEDGRARIELHESVYGVASGQLGVFYDKEKVLGSGWIM